MIIKCDYCQKKFAVPDGAIGPAGRLVQCSSCGNKWTAYPEKDPVKEEKTIQKQKPKVKKQKIKKSKNIDVYSREYLQKKHGIKIIDPSASSDSSTKSKKKVKKIGYGFYNYLITFSVILITTFGLLSLTRDIITFNYPGLEIYINYLFETVNNIRTIIFDLISSYNY